VNFDIQLKFSIVLTKYDSMVGKCYKGLVQLSVCTQINLEEFNDKGSSMVMVGGCSRARYLEKVL